jgi:tetratricopeptide (TPR) repeat protein
MIKHAVLWISMLFLLAPGTAEATKKRAVVHARRALALYAEGRYSEASERFMQAFELSREPTQLRNAAKSAELAGDRSAARARWSMYLELATDPEDIREVNERLEVLGDEEEVEEESPQMVAAAEPDPPIDLSVRPYVPSDGALVAVAQPIPERSSDVPLWLIGGGGLLLGTSLALVGHAETSLSSLRAMLGQKDGDGLIVGIHRAEAEERREGIERERRIAIGVATAGTALLATGLLWLNSAEDAP